MNQIRRELARVCREHLFTEKILICPDYASGHSLLERLALDGGTWLNLHVATVDGLALETAELSMLEQGLSLLPDASGLFLIENIFRSLRPDLEYFNTLEPRPGIIGALDRAVGKLRLAGINSDRLGTVPLPNQRKQRDLVKLLKAYEEVLARDHLVDMADVYRLAMEAVRNRAEDTRLFLVPTDIVLPPHQGAFLEQLAGDPVVFLRAEPVRKLLPPRSAWLVTDEPPVVPSSNVQRLPWLYDRSTLPAAQHDPDDDSVQIFAAYGEYSEAAEVLRRIRGAGLPLDQVTVTYTSYDYAWHFYRLAVKLDLPITFAEGIPLLLTRPGKALKGILQWIEGDFQACTLGQLFLDGLLKTGEEAPGTIRSADILRKAGVCWGRARYQPCLEKLAAYDEAKAADCGTSRYGQYQTQMAEQVRLFKEYIDRLLWHIPAPGDDAQVSFQDFAQGLAGLADGFATVSGSLDGAARQTAADHFRVLAGTKELRIPLTEALERLQRELASLRIYARGPESGHLHVTHYRRAFWLGRQHTYIVGLDARRFPGSGTECPVLLDTERSAIAPELPLAAARPGESLWNLVQFLANLDGTVTLSYSLFDTVAVRDSVPAAVLLQTFRLVRDPSADYSAFREAMQPAAGFVPLPGQELDVDEWWLRVFTDTGSVSPQLVRGCYPDLARGQDALTIRGMDTLTAYDGKINVPPGRFDPRLNNTLILSPSQIETLAKCPFAYFLSCVLRVEKPADRVCDPTQWLAGKEMGFLMHDIFCTYYRKLSATAPGGQQDATLLMEISDELVGGMLEAVPAPSDVVLEQEKRRIRRSLELFLRAEENYSRDSRPRYFEVPFGMGDEAVQAAGVGLADPVTLTMPDGLLIRVCGRIDRLDETDVGYLCIDYKTGSPRYYREQDYVQRGRQIQHALYAIAAEAVLQAGPDPRAVVPRSGYYFPTEKGEACRVLRLQQDRTIVFRLLELLCTLLRNGTFVVAEDGEACRFCDYTSVCRPDAAIKAIKVKLEAGKTPELSILQEVAGIA
ncbi:MAG: PD-(D/E)XK nuclease family protein [Clostridia bacterium]|nr:PD-(D/E)XK nuclease family protein [Clostridia bacterium]